MTTKVFVLTEEVSANGIAFNYPLIYNRRRLLNLGVELNFSTRFRDPPPGTNVLFISSKVFREMWREREEEVYAILSRWRKMVDRMVWFDTADSTGTPQFAVLPYVDFYGKAQLLKDRTLYNTRFLGGRIYADFYAREFGIDNPYSDVKHVVPSKEDMAKVGCSWHSGMGDHSLWSVYLNRFRKHLPIPYEYWAKTTPPDKNREISVTCRVGTSYIHPAISFHRERTMELLDRFQVERGKISRSSYFQELQNCQIAVSPFGLGEITLRDFEIITCGATLFKPDMSHMETFPDLFVPDETYVPFKWDFSDFEEKLEDLLADETKRIELVRNAQNLYKRWITEEDGQMEFCERLLKIIRG